MVAEHAGRVLSKRDKILRVRRRNRFCDDAAQHDDSPGSLLADPDYHMARACGWDVARRDGYYREPEPAVRSDGESNPHYNADERYPVPSMQCATWLWWKSIGRQAQDVLYDLTLCGLGDAEGGSYVVLNPRLLNSSDPRNVNEWGR